MSRQRIQTVIQLREYLAFIGASLLEDEKSVFVGTGLPIIACHAGAEDPRPGPGDRL